MAAVFYKCLSYTIPTYVLKNADPIKQEKFKEDFEVLKKHLEGLVDHVEEHEKYDAEVFLQFLKNTLSQYTTGKIVMVLDNARRELLYVA